MSLKCFQLDGQVALVTGGSRGLGRSMAHALAKTGADIAIASRNIDACERVAGEIRALGRKALALSCDTRFHESVTDMVKKSETELGRIDILVNNAGTGTTQPTLEVSDKDFDLVMGINLKGCLYCAQAVAPGMIARGYGRIINIGSILSLRAMSCAASYVASKHALLGLTRTLAIEWANTGITVNCLCPAFFATDLNKSVRDDPAAYQGTVAHTPMNRWGQEGELDSAILFLAAPASSYVTGIALPVDGGWTAT